ncbi:unnamed protein product [Ectocarpus sp. 6 AP-2014]
MFQPASKIRERYDISRSTLVSWGDSGRVRIRRLGDGGNSGKRIYNVADVETQLGCNACPEKSQKEFIIYARVSSSKQSEDLERQVASLQESYPHHTTLKDIGSGLNYKRKNFEALLERVHSGNVEEVVVSYRDRLCRYGFELVESLCKRHGTKIVVHNKSETEGSQQELSEDLLAVCNFFVARNNGRRGGRGRQRKRRKVEEDQVGPDHRVEGAVAEVDGDGKVDVQPLPSLVEH